MERKPNPAASAAGADPLRRDFSEFADGVLRRTAASLGLSYAQLTSDRLMTPRGARRFAPPAVKGR